MILLSASRPEPVQVLVVLPPGGRVMIHFVDDGSVRDVTELAADLLAEFVLRAPPGRDAAEDEMVTIAEVFLEGCTPEQVRLALIDTGSNTVGELPGDQLIVLLGQAVVMAVLDAVAGQDGAGPLPQPAS